MKTQEQIKPDIARILQTCHELAESQTQFFAMLEAQGITLNEKGGKVTGITIGDTKMSFNDLGYTENSLESIGTPFSFNENLALIDDKTWRERNFIEVPLPDEFSFDVLEKEPEFDTEEGINREDELEEIRGMEGQTKEKELDF